MLTKKNFFKVYLCVKAFLVEYTCCRRNAGGGAWFATRPLFISGVRALERRTG